MPDPQRDVSPISMAVNAPPDGVPRPGDQLARYTVSPAPGHLTWTDVAVIGLVFVFTGWLVHRGQDLQTAVGVPLVLLTSQVIVLRPGALFVTLRRVAQAVSGNSPTPDKP